MLSRRKAEERLMLTDLHLFALALDDGALFFGLSRNS